MLFQQPVLSFPLKQAILLVLPKRALIEITLFAGDGSKHGKGPYL